MSPPQTTSAASGCPSSVSDLRLQAHQRLDTLLDFCLADEPARCFLAFERALLGLLLSLGQILVQLFLRHRHERLDLTDWLARGYRVSDADAPRTLQTAFGPVAYSRAYLLPPEGHGPGVHPLDATLGLTRDSFSPLVIGWFCRMAGCTARTTRRSMGPSAHGRRRWPGHGSKPPAGGSLPTPPRRCRSWWTGNSAWNSDCDRCSRRPS